jgi:hypothetical protein
LLTGHSTVQNPKGHELEVEIRPNVYVSFFRSGVGDFTKLVSNIQTNGMLGGISKSLQGKLAPVARTAIGVMANTNYFGSPITSATKSATENNLSFLKFLATSASPIPFGATPITKTLSEPTTPIDKAINTITVGTGLARYSKNPTESNEGNWLIKYFGTPNEKASTTLLKKIKTLDAAASKQTTSMNSELDAATASGGDTQAVFAKYNIPTDEQVSLLTAAQKKIDLTKLTPLLKAFKDKSKVKQAELYNSLSPDEQRLIDSGK